MSSPRPRRAWHRRKRTWAAAVLLLAAAYPVGIGPAAYCVGRGRLSEPMFLAAYAPVLHLAVAAGPPGEGLIGFAKWSEAAGRKHAAASD